MSRWTAIGGVGAAGRPGVAGGGVGPPAGGRVVKPGGRRPSRIAGRGNALRGGKGHSSRACGKAGREIFGDFGWALAHAGERVGHAVGRWWDGGSAWTAGGAGSTRGGGGVGLGERGPLADPAAIASGLVAAVLSAVGGGPVALSGQPARTSGERRAGRRGYSSGPGVGAAGTSVHIP